LQKEDNSMTWIKTIPASENEEVRRVVEAQREFYPIEYATPVHPTADGETAGIVASHSLIPDALYHAFATFGALMSPDLPLSRRQHEMITTVVSVTNRCHY
jgi:alkylhydroperoxidase family enzyme